MYMIIIILFVVTTIQDVGSFWQCIPLDLHLMPDVRL